MGNKRNKEYYLTEDMKMNLKKRVFISDRKFITEIVFRRGFIFHEELSVILI